MSIAEMLLAGEAKLAVVGMGYVGMPLAVAFSKHCNVIGYDKNSSKINKYKQGMDPTNEVGDELIKDCNVTFTDDDTLLNEADFVIVAVPTPVNLDNTPDLHPMIGACEVVGANLKKGACIVFESTVYPGVTEDICIPALEQSSGMKCGTDFMVGYSPERINPSDKIHKLENITKIVSGMNDDTREEIAKVYEIIIQAGVHRASSIKVAEAAKVVENSQRDINIAFMNELAMVFNRMGIDTQEVIDAMNTKWNALHFYPGLVGGHCIGVDPYYFIYEAEKLGYHSQIILSGRKINDAMGEFVADQIIKNLIIQGKNVKESKVVILGITFKENCPDVRNSKVVDIIHRLDEYQIKPIVVDPKADVDEVKREYGLELTPLTEVKNADCLVFAVAHKEFADMSMKEIDSLFRDMPMNEKIIIDVKSMLDKSILSKHGYTLWRL